MEKYNPLVALVTFTDDRDVGLYSKEVEDHLRRKQEEIDEFLRASDITVVNPLDEIRAAGSVPYGIRNLADIDRVVTHLSGHKIDAVVIGSWNWSPPMLIIDFVRKMDKPFLYYTENDPLAGSLSQLSATCSSLMEWGVNRYALTHERCFGNKNEMLTWVRAMAAVSRMRESSLLLWGGTYAVKMEQLQDDVPRLKSFMVRDVLSEDQYILVSRAEKIMQKQPERIEAFQRWLKDRGMKISFDKKMLTEEAFTKQSALLLAARDRLSELESENIRGVSIKCQPEIYSEYGVDACTLPAFLPFAQNEEGEQRIYPTVCEGDIKGLLTSVLLHALNPDVPPAFGDLISAGDDHVEFANCGAGSVYWAGNSLDAGDVLKNVEAVGNIHGVSGAAFSYYGVESPELTVARLTRIKGDYYMQLGKGRALDAKKFLSGMLGDKVRVHLGQAWGKIVVDLGVRAENLVKVIGANHLSATMGDVTREVETACRSWGIPVVRIDSDQEMIDFYSDIRFRNVRTL
jgi:L-fucose isomerase-like protein